MKNRKLLIIGLLLMVVSIQANESNSTNEKWDYNSPYNHQRPITFTEHGIKFYVYQNGEIDFKKPYTNAYYGSNDYYYRNGRKLRKSKRNNGKHYGLNNSINVSYDYSGRLKRIGKVVIHYNYYGKVTNIGRVFMTYRRNRLTRVGGLKIIRDRYGYTQFVGRVKPQHNNYNTNYYNFYNDYVYDDYIYNYEDEFFYEDDFHNDYEQFKEDDDYFYYRSKTKKAEKSKRGKTQRKSKMIKRKKNSTK